MRPLLHLPRVWHRARSDAALLVVSAAVVASSAALATAVPVLSERAADATTAAAVTADPDRSALVVQVALRDAALTLDLSADTVPEATRTEAARVAAALPGVYGPPVAALGSGRLGTVLATGEQGLTSLRLVVPWRDGPPAVRWTSGGPVTTPDGIDPADGPDGPDGSESGDGERPLPVGLAEPVAAALGVGVGDAVPALAGDQEVPVVVSGTFVAVDAADPVWDAAPGLLAPLTTGAGRTTAVDVAALVDEEQAGALADLSEVLPVLTTTQRARPERLTDAAAVRTARAAAALEAAHQDALPGLDGADIDVRTGLDAVLLDARARVDAARAQAAVVLAALLATAAAVLVLAASLLADRRAHGLVLLRSRGTPFVVVAAESGVEALAVAVVATAAGVGGGLWAADALTDPGPRAVLGAGWLLPLLLVAVVAPAVAAVHRAAAGSGDLRGSSSWSLRGAAARRRRDRDRRRRAVAVEAALVALAALALAAALQGGSGAGAAAGPLPAASVALGTLAVALLARRAVAPALPALRARAARGRDAVRVVAVARAVGAAGRVVPAATLVVAVGCATTGLVLAAVLRGGLEQGSWQAVGADAVLTGPPGGADGLAAPLSAAPGVTAVRLGHVEEAVLLANDGSHAVRLVAADPADLRALLEAGDAGGLGPERTVQQLALLAGAPTGAGSPVPVLLSSPLQAASGSAPPPVLRWAGGDVDAVVVGAGPRWGGDGEVTAVVDRSALQRATGVAVPSTTAWVVGAGAATAATAAVATAEGGGQQVALRSTWLHERSGAPAVRALLGLTTGAAVVLVVLAALAVALGAVATAPSRRRDSAVLELLGAGSGAARRLAVAEVVPAVVVAALLGAAAGAALAGLLRGALGLRVLTGQLQDPALHAVVVLPVLVLPALALVGVATAVALAVDAGGRGRARGGARLR